MRSIFILLSLIFLSSVAQAKDLNLLSSTFNWQQDPSIVATLLIDGKEFRYYHSPKLIALQHCQDGKVLDSKLIEEGTSINFLNLETDDLLLFPLKLDQIKKVGEEKKHLIYQFTQGNKSNAKIWIKKDNALIQKKEVYNSQNKLIRKTIIVQAERQSGNWRVVSARIEDLQKNKSIELEWKDYQVKELDLKQISKICF